MSPGMGVDKYVLSSDDMKNHRDVIHHWGPCQLVRKLMSDEGFDAHLTNPVTGKDESLQDLVCFGSPEVSPMFRFLEFTKMMFFSQSIFRLSFKSVI